MNTQHDPSDLCRLASRALDGAASPDELQRLENLLAESADARQLYYRLIDMHSRLAWTLGETASADSGKHADALPPAPDAQPAVAEQLAPRSPVLGFLSTTVGNWTTWLGTPKVLAIALAGSLAAYFVVLTISLALTHHFAQNRGERLLAARPGDDGPQAQAAAALAKTATGSLSPDTQARWAAGAAPQAGIEPGRRYELAQGRVQLVLASGAELAIAGPAVWQVDSPQRLHLTSGKLIAYVPPQAVGFTVATPLAEVVDLGTEFGVVVDDAGTADVHVYRGQVELKPAGAPAAVQSTRVTVGQSRRIEPGGRVTIGSSNSAAALRAEIPTPGRSVAALDLVDLLAGGDGRGRQRNLRIDPRSGQWGNLPTVADIAGDTTYHPAPQHRVLDGCFMPDRLTQVDTAGHRFEFAATSGQTCYHIWAGERSQLGNFALHGGIAKEAGDGPGALFLNANKGLTLDLQAIRRLNADAQLVALAASAENSIPLDHLAQARPGQPPPKSNLLVLVDGILRFECKDLVPGDPAVAVKVPLTNNDRFLTIAVTDGGDTFWGDWITLDDPRLLLRPAER